MSTPASLGVDGSDAIDSDAELLARHVAGDPVAFTVLVQRHRDRLWAVALRTTSNPDDAADALQDALLSAFRRADTFRGESAVTTWLHRIVVNAALDRMRRAAVRPTVALPTGEDGVTLDIPDGRDDIGQRENQLVIAQALADLPDDQRQAVLLVDVEGYSVEDAAALLNCPTGTVKSRCSRGRAKLARQLAHLRNPDQGGTVVPDEGGGRG